MAADGAGKSEQRGKLVRAVRLCTCAVIAYLLLCICIAARLYWVGRSEYGSAAVDPGAESGSCAAQGGDCRQEQWWAADDQELSHEHLWHVDTFNFNTTVTSGRPLLVAFYDPRSQSFKDVRPHLEEAAKAVSRLESSGSSIGKLGVCDVTVNTYLGELEAPELREGWQQFREEAFRFGKPRFFPVIAIVYEGGRRLGEYTGVLSAKHISAYLQRQSSVRGGEALEDADALRLLLRGPGPFAIGCGLESGPAEAGAFNRTAHDLHGTLIFGRASESACTEVLGSLPAPPPQLAWADSGGLGRLRFAPKHTLLSGAGALSDWLSSHRHELLEEMTPDTSHKYLERSQPLLIFLVDPGDKFGWDHGVAMLSVLEKKLLGEVQLVWSDCLVFGPQFGAKGKCPAFVIVETEGMTWRKMPLATLEGPEQEGGGRNSSKRLLRWLRNTTGLRLSGKDAGAKPLVASSLKESRPAAVAMPRDTRSASIPAPRTPPAPVGDEGNAEVPVEDDDYGGKSSHVMKGLTEGAEEEFLKTMPQISAEANINFLWTNYQTALRQVLQLQASYESRYGGRLPFDFSDVQRAQKLHPSMRSLASSPASLQRQLQEPQQAATLRRAIEWRAGFEFNSTRVATNEYVKNSFVASVRQGYDMLRGVFLRLFEHLHHHARAGTMGVPEAKERPVDRRSASGLSVKEFIEHYAKPGRPVIISDVNITEEEPWTMEFFRRRCNVTASYLRRNALKWAWGRLEDAGELPLADFLDTFTTNSTRRAWYLHDWSLPKNCPAVFGEAPYRGFTVPKYFAGDYFQRAAFDGYQHTWPSLFVGSEETQSALHIDSGGTNFWLYLLSGRKEWRFFSRRDLVNVYQSPLHTHFLPDAFSPDLEKYPLLKYAEMFVGIQNPGDIMFIPGGNPHAVRNLEPIHGVSMNYVDASNVWIHLWHMLAEGNWPAFELFTDGVTFPHGLRSDQQPMAFGEWKSARWKELTYDLH